MGRLSALAYLSQPLTTFNIFGLLRLSVRRDHLTCASIPIRGNQNDEQNTKIVQFMRRSSLITLHLNTISHALCVAAFLSAVTDVVVVLSLVSSISFRAKQQHTWYQFISSHLSHSLRTAVFCCPLFLRSWQDLSFSSFTYSHSLLSLWSLNYQTHQNPPRSPLLLLRWLPDWSASMFFSTLRLYMILFHLSFSFFQVLLKLNVLFTHRALSLLLSLWLLSQGFRICIWRFLLCSFFCLPSPFVFSSSSCFLSLLTSKKIKANKWTHVL